MNPNSGFAISAAFDQCINLKEVSLPPQLKTVHQWAFRGCTTLNSVYLNEGLKTIQGRAFVDTNKLKRIVIPSSLTTLGNSSSAGNAAFQYVTVYIMHPTIPPTVGIWSSYITISAIYVPDESLDTYKSAEKWSDYASKIHPLSEYTG